MSTTSPAEHKNLPFAMPTANVAFGSAVKFPDTNRILNLGNIEGVKQSHLGDLMIQNLMFGETFPGRAIDCEEDFNHLW